MLPDWSSLAPPHPQLAFSVVVPVRNESERLHATLAALAAQRDADGKLFDSSRYEILLLANNCTDASADVARRFAAQHPHPALHVVEVQFAPEQAHVGQARASLMAAACQRLRSAGSDARGGAGIICSTDGDTQVAPDWLAALEAEFTAGADAVGGRIDMAPVAADPPGLRRLVALDATYQRLRVRLESLIDPDPGDPWPRHHQHFGANFALRADAHEAVGGCPAVPFLEDEALYRRLRAHDLTVRHSERVRVLTSGRRDGRVAVGLSQQLSEWAQRAASDEPVWVPHPADWARRLEGRRRLRALWQSTHRSLPSTPSTPFGTLWEQREQALDARAESQGLQRRMPLTEAIELLHALIDEALSAHSF